MVNPIHASPSHSATAAENTDEDHAMMTPQKFFHHPKGASLPKVLLAKASPQKKFLCALRSLFELSTLSIVVLSLLVLLPMSLLVVSRPAGPVPPHEVERTDGEKGDGSLDLGKAWHRFQQGRRDEASPSEGPGGMPSEAVDERNALEGVTMEEGQSGMSVMDRSQLEESVVDGDQSGNRSRAASTSMHGSLLVGETAGSDEIVLSSETKFSESETSDTDIPNQAAEAVANESRALGEAAIEEPPSHVRATTLGKSQKHWWKGKKKREKKRGQDEERGEGRVGQKGNGGKTGEKEGQGSLTPRAGAMEGDRGQSDREEGSATATNPSLQPQQEQAPLENGSADAKGVQMGGVVGGSELVRGSNRKDSEEGSGSEGEGAGASGKAVRGSENRVGFNSRRTTGAGAVGEEGRGDEREKDEEEGNGGQERQAEVEPPVGTSQCHLAEGDWVLDNSRPLYDGKKCKWAAPNWVCRRGDRPDFNYERYRWQPRGCHLAPFNGSHFLQRMRHRKVAFIGDSLGLQQFQSLLCILSHGLDPASPVESIGSEFGFYLPPGKRSPTGWAYRFPPTNTTIIYASSVSLCDIVPHQPEEHRFGAALHIDRPDPFLKQFVAESDVLLLNTGHHWNKNKRALNNWTLYMDGAPVTLREKRDEEMSFAKGLSLNHTMRWLDERMRSMARPPLVLLRTISPRHFMSGEWNTGGRCDFLKMGAEGLERRRTRDEAAELAVTGTSVKLLNITNLSDLRGEAHPAGWDYWNKTGKMDCLHWCLPGIPDTWNEVLYWQIVMHEAARGLSPW